MPAASVRVAAAAVTFLTRVPVARSSNLDGADVARAASLFPVVGLAVGACAGGVALGLGHVLPSLAASALGVAVALVLTGALHLDALADVADAAGAFTRERALEIMRDSRVGTFGAAAIVLDLLLKVVAIGALIGRGGAVQAVAASGALSRAAGLPIAAFLPYPRVGGGIGSVLTGRIGRLAPAVGTAFAIAIAVALLGWTGAIMAGVAAATAVVAIGIYRRWLGGATGDCIGAVIELTELAVLLVAAARA